MKLAAMLLPFLSLLAWSAPPRNLIIDTDAGSDDLMAIAFLLARPDVNIEAITIVNGLAHVPAGGANVLRLLELAGRPAIPVYLGRATPLSGTNEFPEVWRTMSDQLPHVQLPSTQRTSGKLPAAAYLRERLGNARKPVSILALGPLTNIAEALASLPNSMLALDDLVIMGGAVRVAGNLAAGGTLYSDNRTAEWNIYIDPEAARKVFESVERCRLVPLDASNSVPIDAAFQRALETTAKSSLGRLVAQIVASNRILIDQHEFYAWDPLAAVALVAPAVLKISSVPLTVTLDAPQQGRTMETNSGRPLRVALSADPALFRKTYLEALR